MAKYTVKNSDIIKVVASTKLKIGKSIKTTLPNRDGNEYITTVEGLVQDPISANLFKIKVPNTVYDGWFDIGYVKEIL